MSISEIDGRLEPFSIGRANDATIAFTIERLRTLREANGGRLPHGEADQARRDLGIGASTLRRYLADAPPQPRATRSRWEWSDVARVAFYRAAGDVSYARQILLEEEGAHAVASLPTMYRALYRDLRPDEIALARAGHAAARSKRFVVPIEEVCRNDTWLADHSQLSLKVVPSRGSRAVLPWMTVIEDGYSRRVVGASIGVIPNQGHIFAALGMGIRRCGTPRCLVVDRGADYLAAAVRRHATALGYAHSPTRAYHPHHKGKVERLHQTLNRMLAQYFGSTHTSARDIRGRPLLGERDAIPFDEFEQGFFAVIERYNRKHRHRSLGGSTPLAVYDGDPTLERHVPPETLRRFLLSGSTRRINEHGIRFRSRHYWTPEIEGFRGESVEVRYAQDDQRELHLYRDERFWCTARLVDPASPEQKEQVLVQRKKHVERQKKDLARAKRLARTTLRASTAGQAAEDATIISSAEAQRETRGTPDRLTSALRQMNVTTDLDETDPGAPTPGSVRRDR